MNKCVHVELHFPGGIHMKARVRVEHRSETSEASASYTAKSEPFKEGVRGGKSAMLEKGEQNRKLISLINVFGNGKL